MLFRQTIANKRHLGSRTSLEEIIGWNFNYSRLLTKGISGDYQLISNHSQWLTCFVDAKKTIEKINVISKLINYAPQCTNLTMWLDLPLCFKMKLYDKSFFESFDHGLHTNFSWLTNWSSKLYDILVILVGSCLIKLHPHFVILDRSNFRLGVSLSNLKWSKHSLFCQELCFKRLSLL